MGYTSLDAFLLDLPAHAAKHEKQLKGHDVTVLLRTLQGRQIRLTLRDGKISYDNGADGNADCTVTADENQLLAMINGQLHPMKALLLNKISVKGDVARLIALARLL